MNKPPSDSLYVYKFNDLKLFEHGNSSTLHLTSLFVFLKSLSSSLFPPISPPWIQV